MKKFLLGIRRIFCKHRLTRSFDLGFKVFGYNNPEYRFCMKCGIPKIFDKE